MNERIREIAEAADFYVGNEHYDKSREEQSRLQSRLLMQRFAELIIQECIDLVPWLYEAKIKEHFGVTK